MFLHERTAAPTFRANMRAAHRSCNSRRGIGEQASKREVEAYKPPVSSSTTTLGDLINLKRASNDQN